MTVVNSNLSFDGSISTADQFSTARDFSNVSLPTAAAWLLDVDLGNGPFSTTLQVNADPTSQTVLGWEDVALTTLRILDMTASLLLDQTDAAIESSKLRGGIVKGASLLATLFFQFEPAAASYRLRFQIAAATKANINNIIIVP